jgi:hypothetical protein
MFLEVTGRTDLQTLKGKLVERSIERYEIEYSILCCNVMQFRDIPTSPPPSGLKNKPPRHQAHPRQHGVTA